MKTLECNSKWRIKNMSAYDLELIRLINKAKLQGYDFIDGKFNKSKEENIFVLNLRSNSIGDGESMGNYEMFDKMYIITTEQKDTLSMCSNIDEVIDVLENIIEDEDYKYCKLWEDLFSLGEPFWFNNDKKELSKINKYPTYLSIGIYHESCNIHGSIQIFQYTQKQFNKHKQTYINCFNVNDPNY